jgi:septal ring factor EnvC (AmiA/AmiB activator)
MTEESGSNWFVRFLRVLIRLLLVLLLGILIGAAIFFGIQYAYQQVVIPSQQNTAALAELDTRVNQQWQLIQDNNQDVEKRLSILETNQDDLNNRLAELVSNLAQTSADLEVYHTQQNDLSEKVADMDHVVAELGIQIADLSDQNEETKTKLETIDLATTLDPVYQQLETFKILLQINRSRLFLLQDNYGLAQRELELAGAMLDALSAQVGEDQADEISIWQSRLDLAISHLPDSPILAADDLEILWSLMADEYSTSSSTDQELSTTQENETEVVEPTVTATVTPTPKP